MVHAILGSFETSTYINVHGTTYSLVGADTKVIPKTSSNASRTQTANCSTVKQHSPLPRANSSLMHVTSLPSKPHGTIPSKLCNDFKSTLIASPCIVTHRRVFIPIAAIFLLDTHTPVRLSSLVA